MKGDNVFQSVGFILATEGSRKQIFVLSHKWTTNNKGNEIPSVKSRD